MRSQSSSRLAKENKTIARRSPAWGWCRFCIAMWDVELQMAAEKMVAVERADEKLAGGSDEEAGGQS